jgi:hypothetical protein
LYFCNGIVSSNCRSTILPIFAWEVADGSEKLQPIPKGAAQALPGFGSTAMAIPDTPGRRVRQMEKQIKAATSGG